MLLTLSMLMLAPAENATDAAQPADAAKPALVCRRGQPTNSLVPTRKICLTAEEWARRDGAVTKTGARAAASGTKQN